MKFITVKKMSKLLMASLIGLFALNTTFADNWDVPITVVNNTDNSIRFKCEEESPVGRKKNVTFSVDAKKTETQQLNVDGIFLSLILCQINGKTIKSSVSSSVAAGYPYFKGTKLKFEVDSVKGTSGPTDLLSIVVKINDAIKDKIKI